MWKYLLALVVLMTFGGLAVAEVDYCVDCYANSVVQTDDQTLSTVSLANDEDDNAAVGNEALSAGIIVTKKLTQPADDATFIQASFGRIDQRIDQDLSAITGAKGVSENKAIQAAWVQGQGRKEVETPEDEDCTDPTVMKEGALVMQKTTQDMNTVTSYDCQDDARVFNADNKLAMIVDDLQQVIDISASATSDTSDGASSDGTITNNVDIDVGDEIV